MGRAGRGRVPCVVVVDQGAGAREEGAAGGEVDEVLGGEHLRVRVELWAPAELVGHARVAALRDAERRGCVEEAGVEIPFHVLDRVTDWEAAAEGRQRELHVLEGDGVAARSAHAERVPVVVDDDARGFAGDQA